MALQSVDLGVIYLCSRCVLTLLSLMGRRLEENGFLVFFCGRVVHAASENSPSGGNGLRQILTANEASGKWYFQQNKTSRKIKIFALLRRKWFPGMAHRWGIRPRTYPKTIKFRGEFFPVWYNGGFCVLWIFFFLPRTNIEYLRARTQTRLLYKHFKSKHRRFSFVYFLHLFRTKLRQRRVKRKRPN